MSATLADHTEDQALDLTRKIFDVGPFPINSSGAYCDIYLAKHTEQSGHSNVALKRLRLTGNPDEKEKNMGKVIRVRVVSAHLSSASSLFPSHPGQR